MAINRAECSLSVFRIEAGRRPARLLEGETALNGHPSLGPTLHRVDTLDEAVEVQQQVGLLPGRWRNPRASPGRRRLLGGHRHGRLSGQIRLWRCRGLSILARRVHSPETPRPWIFISPMPGS